ncbi:MAG: hypothetical protein ACXW4M_02730, partial [Anaerolineales bacterium]
SQVGKGTKITLSFPAKWNAVYSRFSGKITACDFSPQGVLSRTPLLPVWNTNIYIVPRKYLNKKFDYIYQIASVV